MWAETITNQLKQAHEDFKTDINRYYRKQYKRNSLNMLKIKDIRNMMFL